MITKQTIMDAYLFLRKNNNTIPDETLDFIRDVSLTAYEKMKVGQIEPLVMLRTELEEEIIDLTKESLHPMNTEIYTERAEAKLNQTARIILMIDKLLGATAAEF